MVTYQHIILSHAYLVCLPAQAWRLHLCSSVWDSSVQGRDRGSVWHGSENCDVAICNWGNRLTVLVLDLTASFSEVMNFAISSFPEANTLCWSSKSLGPFWMCERVRGWGWSREEERQWTWDGGRCGYTCLQITIVLYGDHDSSIVLPVSWQDPTVSERGRVYCVWVWRFSSHYNSSMSLIHRLHN